MRLRFAPVLALFCLTLTAQDEPDPKTLLPPRIINAIANESSGSLAWQRLNGTRGL